MAARKNKTSVLADQPGLFDGLEAETEFAAPEPASADSAEAQKPKILFILTRLDGGGAQKSVLHLIKSINNIYEVHAASGEGGLLTPEFEAACTLHIIKNLCHDVCISNGRSDIKAVWETGRLIRQIKPGIINTATPKAGIIGRLAGFLFYGKAARVHTYHGLGFDHEKKDFKRSFFIFLEQLAGWISKKLIFVSMANLGEATVLGIGRNKKRLLIYAPIEFDNTDNFDRKAKLTELGISEDKKIVLSAGNFKALKNAKDFVRVCAEVSRDMSNVLFLYAGSGGEGEEDVKAFAHAMGLEGSLQFLGFRNDMAELMQLASLYISTSLREGLPFAVIEALHCGTPVLAYDADGTAEVVRDGENGYIFKPGDYKSIAEKIKEILSDDILESALSGAAFDSSLEQFSDDNTVGRYIDMYNELLKK
ncbi:Glycosyltransferase involved in cell wall bisynthesis [Parelusimicrobium proximum]|uniref:glycosyltransferase n=1 Tax=Parelusimicrobium proximum TaxID=3228953 RepID=UPI003D1765AF